LWVDESGRRAAPRWLALLLLLLLLLLVSPRSFARPARKGKKKKK
jgi:hypothetical protein